ncbi:MAG: hypothetical protein U9Q79_08035, partial [Candidatus Hydrogenedentes bacterium]|nr:hypothetical protein [Candidatus Hydrogenedentota bacterium]
METPTNTSEASAGQLGGGSLWRSPSAVFLGFFVVGLALRLIPWNRTLVGWDEWILSTISSRWALVALPENNLYDLIVPTYYSYPPVFFWLQGLTIFLFG